MTQNVTFLGLSLYSQRALNPNLGMLTEYLHCFDSFCPFACRRFFFFSSSSVSGEADKASAIFGVRIYLTSTFESESTPRGRLVDRHENPEI